MKQETKHSRLFAARQSDRSFMGTVLCMSKYTMLLLFVMLMPLGTWAAGTQPSGTGTGTGDPYLIDTADKLIWFRDAVNGVNTTAANGGIVGKTIIGKLTADIDLGGAAWTPIGKDASHAFTGKLYGEGFTIKGLNVTTSEGTASYWGLFGCLDGAEIKNFTINGSISVTSSSYSYIGTMAGCATGSSKIISVNSEVNINVNSGQTPSYIGGIVGSVGRSGYNCNSSSKTPTATVQECTYTGTISCAKSHTAIGGIVGGVWYGSAETEWNHGIKINKCIFTGAINRTENTTSLGTYPGIGGILGSAKTTGEAGITYNLSEGTITCDVANNNLANCMAAIIGRPDGSKFPTTYVNYNCGLSKTSDKLFGNNKESAFSNNCLLTVSSNNTTFGTVSIISHAPTSSSGYITLDLEATPLECCKLIEWTDHETSETRTVTINNSLTSNLTLTAYFKQVEPYHNEIWYTTTDGSTIENNSLKNQMGLTGSTYDSANSRYVMNFSGNLTGIAPCAFQKCNTLRTITIPSSVTKIDYQAFEGCSSLTDITIPNGVTTIEGSAFSDCRSAQSIYIPSSVTVVGMKAFTGCAVIGNNITNVSSITNATLEEQGLTICDTEQADGLLIKDAVAVLCRPNATNVTIPSKVTTIGPSAFKGCSGLTTTSSLSSVKTIREFAFSGCSSLTAINDISNVTSIGAYAFENCSSLTAITIPSGVTSIADYTYSGCSKIRALEIPTTVESVGDYAFQNCRDIESINAHTNRNIKFSAHVFTGCAVLESKTDTVVKHFYQTNYYGDFGLQICTEEQADGLMLTKHFYRKSDNANPDSKYSFASNWAVLCRSWATDVTVPSRVDSVLNGAFNNCDKLQNITFNGIPWFGNYVFSGTPAGRSINFCLKDDSFVETKNNPRIPSSFTSATFTRSLTKQWGTIVVPFDLNITGNETDYDLYTITAVSDSELTLTKITGTHSAGSPAFVRMSEASRKDGHYKLNLTASNNIIKTPTNGVTIGDLTIIGGYKTIDISGGFGYILSNNAFWSIDYVKAKSNNELVYNLPFHAYLKTENQNNGTPVRLSIGCDDDGVNGIEAIDALSSGEAQYYDLNGRRIPDLQHGINIVKRGNKTFKVIIK